MAAPLVSIGLSRFRVNGHGSETGRVVSGGPGPPCPWRSGRPRLAGVGQDQSAGVRVGERKQVDFGVVAPQLGERAGDESPVHVADHLGVAAGHVQQGAPS